MKSLKILLALSFMFTSFYGYSAKKEKDTNKFKLEFKVKGLENDSHLIIANYFGLKQYYYDTAFATEKGTFVHETDSIPGGIYLVVMPENSGYFEVMVSGTEKYISMSTSKNDLIGEMEVLASEENKKFYNFQKAMSEKSAAAGPLQTKLTEYRADSTGNSDDLIKNAEDEMQKLNAEVIEFKIKFIEENEGTFVAKVFKTSQEPDVPKNDELTGDELNEWKYNYFKSRYLENVDFTDERLLRTPILGKKIDYYIQKLTVQIPDSINEAADMMASRAKPNKEVYKYVVHWITNTYEKSKIMGMDRVFVHMSENYFCTDEGAWWLDSAATTKICDRSTTLKPLLIGEKAENIILVDTTEKKWHNLHEINADMTVIVFWSPTCGHCKKAMPLLEKEVQQVYKDSGVFIFGVSTELENDQMATFIKSKGLTFLNVSDSKEINEKAYDYLGKNLTTLNSLNFRTVWDVFSTPQVYILDKNKVIVAKKIAIEQLGEFIADYRKVERSKLANKASSGKEKEMPKSKD